MMHLCKVNLHLLFRREYLGLAANPVEPAMKLLMFAWAAIVVSCIMF